LLGAGVKLKLDLHDIFSDGRRIEEALQSIIDEAVDKRAAEVEIIPGKGSGALKKSVLRFLERPEIKARYHRVEKDGDNWGRLFVHFRHDRTGMSAKQSGPPEQTVTADCACCGGQVSAPVPDDPLPSVRLDCPWCGSPNRLILRRDRRGILHAPAELDYSDAGPA
jgi:hypothetical protein